jgi:Rieske Fe-S protein
MNRRSFAQSCITCIAGSVWVPVVNACQSTQHITGKLEPNGISVDRSEFITSGNGKLRSFIIVRHDDLQFPIYVYRFSDNEYSALWMKCSHQGNELSASGDHLTCSAHGSEFNNKGRMVQGPAETNLRSFPVTVSGDQLFIDLRA